MSRFHRGRGLWTHTSYLKLGKMGCIASLAYGLVQGGLWMKSGQTKANYMNDPLPQEQCLALPFFKRASTPFT